MTFTDLRTYNQWQSVGRGVLKGEKHVVRSRAGCLFDISQTADIEQAIEEQFSRQMRKQLRGMSMYDYIND